MSDEKILHYYPKNSFSEFVENLNDLRLEGSPKFTLVVGSFTQSHQNITFLQLYEMLRLYPNQIKTVARGKLDTASILLFLAGDVRASLRLSVFFLNGSFSLQTKFDEINKEASKKLLIERSQYTWDLVTKAFQERAGISPTKLQTLSKRIGGLKATEVKELGIATRIENETNYSF